MQVQIYIQIKLNSHYNIYEYEHEQKSLLCYFDVDINPYGAGSDFSRQNLTSIVVRI